MSTPVRRLRLLTIAVVAMGALLIAESTVLGATLLKSGGPVKAIKIVADDFILHTTSIAFVNMTGMSTTMNVPSGQKALLLITVSAACEVTGSGGSGFVKALVDGSDALADAQVFCSSGAPQASNSYQYFAGPLNAGNHTVALQFRVNNAAGHVYFTNTVMTIMRVKVG